MSIFSLYCFCFCLLVCIPCFALEPVILLCGCPGAGKGFFSEYAQTRGYGHVSVGHMIRKLITDRAEYRLKWEATVKAGDYINQDEVDGVLFKKINLALKKNPKLIIDAYVRSVDAALRIKAFLSRIDQLKNCCAVIIDSPDEVCLGRIQHRLICSKCEKIFSDAVSIEHQECPSCLKGLIERRLGDSMENSQKRIKYYRNIIEPCLKEALQGMTCYKINSNCSFEELKAMYDRALNVSDPLKKV